MERGQPFAAALAEMQARGIAEADPSLDVDGWDAAAKTAALANVLLDARITPHEVDRRPASATLDPATLRAAALAAGRRFELVARAGATAIAIAVERRLRGAAGRGSCWRGLEGQQNALVLDTDLLDEIGSCSATAD